MSVVETIACRRPERLQAARRIAFVAGADVGQHLVQADEFAALAQLGEATRLADLIDDVLDVLGAGPLAQFLGIAGAVIATAFAGWVFTWLRSRSGSLIAPIALHWCLNGAGALPGLVLPAFDWGFVKLSAPYRGTRDTRAHLDRLTGLLPAGRFVWGSDWPHPPPHDEHRGPDAVAAWRSLSYSGLLERFIDAVGSDALVDQIMWENPARLYGWSPEE